MGALDYPPVLPVLGNKSITSFLTANTAQVWGALTALAFLNHLLPWTRMDLNGMKMKFEIAEIHCPIYLIQLDGSSNLMDENAYFYSSNKLERFSVKPLHFTMNISLQ